MRRIVLLRSHDWLAALWNSRSFGASGADLDGTVKVRGVEFSQMVGALVAAGADVLFAAGSCGHDCPDGRCSANDMGPGASIHGANSHPSVITIAAATERGTRLGYCSQGPGDLYDRKPDVAAHSHFAGSGVYKADIGTSAACPVAAGVVAALRQKWPKITPAAMKGIIQMSISCVSSSIVLPRL